MSSTAFFEELSGLLKEGERVAVATIARTRGSSPREVGTKMLVRPDGGILGTVGGGCGEAEVRRAAMDVIDTGIPQVVTVDLTEEISMNTDGVCGGILDVFVQPWSGSERRTDDQEHPSHATIAAELARSIKKREPVAAATVIRDYEALNLSAGDQLVVHKDGSVLGSLGPAQRAAVAEALASLEAGKSATLTCRFVDGQALARTSPNESPDLLIECFYSSPTLVIVGAGHIGVPLAAMAKLLDFQAVVLDDRPAYANRERFPQADEIRVVDFENALKDYAINDSTYIVLVTRGHVHDVLCLRQVIHSPAAYIGMIGSKRRVFAVMKLLHREGVPVEALKRLHAPIGLDIGAETPSEIALCIMAEIVDVLRKGRARGMSDEVRDRYARLLEKGEDL